MAPKGPEKYLKDDKGQIIKSGKAQRPTINPEWKKIEDLHKSLTSVKPKKITMELPPETQFYFGLTSWLIKKASLMEHWRFFFCQK